MRGGAIARWFAIAMAVAGLALFARWMGAHPLETSARRDFLPFFVDLSQIAVAKGGVFGAASLWLIALAGATCAGIALFLALKGRGNPAAIRLSVALGASGLSLAYFYFLVPYPIAGVWLGPATPASTLFVLDAAGYVLWALGMWHLLGFFRVFPQTVTQADWERNVSAFLAENRDVYASGWRRWLYPRRFNDPAHWESPPNPGWLQRLLWSGKDPREVARLHQYAQSRGVLLALCAFAFAAAGAQYALRLQLEGLPANLRASSTLAILPTLFVWLSGAAAGLGAYSYLKFHRRWGSDDDRRRLEWIHSTVFVAGVLFMAAFQGTFAVFVLLVLFALESLPASGLEMLLLLPLTFGLPLFAVACVASLALSVFYRGAIDPRHAARKVTLWGLLGILVTVAFVVIERVVALKVTEWLAMPPETGPLVAGALVAATVAPIRGRVERLTNELVSRYLPVDFIAGGERREAAIALSDLSGYTALSDRDEKQALLLAALLQQRAARVAASHGGRIVKTMGDAILFEFDSASQACAGLLELHATFPEAARALGLEPLPLHSGVHWGEVTVGPDGDVYGQTVNLAARLLGVADAERIVVSNALAAAAGLPSSDVRTLGKRSLKNVSEPVLCHELMSAAAEAALL